MWSPTSTTGSSVLTAVRAHCPAGVRAYGEMVGGMWAFHYWVSDRRSLPLFTEVSQMVSAIPITVAIFHAILRPFGRPFKVTDKGQDRSQVTVLYPLAIIFLSIIVLTFVFEIERNFFLLSLHLCHNGLLAGLSGTFLGTLTIRCWRADHFASRLYPRWNMFGYLCKNPINAALEGLDDRCN